jgi:transposase-like protein
MVQRNFTKTFKLEAKERVTEWGVSVPQADRQLNFAESVPRSWVFEGSIRAFLCNSHQRAQLAEIAAIKQHVAKLKAVRDNEKASPLVL